MSQSHNLIGGRFEIYEMIGQGGMGDVFRGMDTHTNQPVAIKLLKPEIIADNPELVERFVREGEALRKLNHPSIVKMLASVDENNQRYIVMEYVSGGSLQELLRASVKQETHLPIVRVLEIALDLADALTRAHRLKIIHRDLKPANVLMAEDGTPRLTDFGVAQIGDKTHMTQTGSMIGTYAYMSPEACMGEPLDERTDIWSFGIMLYEMLAGRRPFDSDQPAVIITAILQKPVPDLLQFRSDVPPALTGLIYSMLEKDRGKRLGSARLVGAQLEALLKGSDTAIDRMAKVFSDADHPPTPTPVQSDLTTHDAEDAPTLTPLTPSVRQTSTPTARTALDLTHPIKRVAGAPRIFLSYRRDDSISVTGRIYDRFVEAFGEQYIFKDVDKIPVGANFKTILENEVTSCDVLLTIIGDKWLDIRDEEGHRRLDDPHDFVRIEVAAALSRPDLLVVPVLVNNAFMPGADNLPGELYDLAFRNAAVVRNDPDFNRDIRWLIEQIRSKFEIVPPQPPRRIPWTALAIVAAFIIIGLVGYTLIRPALVPDPTSLPATQSAALVPAVVPTVEPVPAGNQMVLVANFAVTGGKERDVAGTIAGDLKQHFEDEAPFSNVNIRRWSGVITSDDQARQVAEQAGAAVIIWGQYDERGVEAAVQVGSLKTFNSNAFARADIEKLANLRALLTDERAESLAFMVNTALEALYTTANDTLGSARITNVGNQFTGFKLAEPVGNGLAARWSRIVTLFEQGKSQESLQAASDAIALNDRNPMLYIARSLIYQKLSQYDTAVDDIRTSRDLGPAGWTTPIFSLGNDALFLRNKPAEAIPYFSEIITLTPDDAAPYAMRGVAYYFTGQQAAAARDMRRSVELGIDFNAPYFLAAAFALREGRFGEAQTLTKLIRQKFPNPTTAQRLLEGAYGSSAAINLMTSMSKAFGNMMLRQWLEVIKTVDEAEKSGLKLTSESYTMAGIAQCNLKNYPAAEAAYTKAIALDTNFPLIYGLRAEVRLKQNNSLGALADVGVVLQSPQKDIFAALVPLIQSGKLNCENLFDYDLSGLPTPAAALTDATTLAPTAAATLAPTAAPTEPAILTPTAEATAQVSAPVQRGQWLVLVAELEPLADKRDVTRFIVRDLQTRLEKDVPFSQVKVRTTSQIIKSEDEAQAAAETAGAAVVVWGNYDSKSIELNVEIGSLAAFPTMKFDRQTLERTANITIHLTDERAQSIVNPVLGILSVLQEADSDGYETLRTIAILDQIQAPPLTIDGSSVAARVQRAVQVYITDTKAAQEELSAAISLDSGNPILYTFRAAARQRLGSITESMQDLASAERRGPDNWVLPLILRGTGLYMQGDIDGAINAYTKTITARPDDWFPLNMRAAFYYLQGKYDLAKADYARAIVLKPNTNFPFVVSAMIALREGRMADARALFDTILKQFPDPNFASRVANSAFGDHNNIIFGPMFSAIGHLTLEQYDQMLADVQAALKINDKLADLYNMEGFAYCNLGQYPEAEASYNRSIQIEPNLAFSYMLRADARLKQLNVLGANEDSNHARDLIKQNGQGDELNAYLDAGLKLQVGCQNFFTWKP